MESDKKTDVPALTDALEAVVMEPAKTTDASVQTDDPKEEVAPQKTDVSAKTDIMESAKKLDASNQTEDDKKMKDILEVFTCPVCLDEIRDSPVYICENPQGHSVCAKCHKSLRNERKPCPTCRQPLGDRRNLLAENLIEILPQTCRFEGCDHMAQDRAALKKHEEDCDHRHVPCAYCDHDKIGMQRLGEHLEKKHGSKQLPYNGLSTVSSLIIRKTFIKDHQF